MNKVKIIQKIDSNKDLKLCDVPHYENEEQGITTPLQLTKKRYPTSSSDTNVHYNRFEKAQKCEKNVKTCHIRFSKLI